LKQEDKILLRSRVKLNYKKCNFIIMDGNAWGWSRRLP
jgi:hypothetical protein